MNHTKQKSKIKLTIFLILPIVFILILAVSFTSAQTSVSELQNNVSDKQQELEQLRTEIGNLQKQINQKNKETATLKNEIALYDLQIRQTQTQIDSVQLQIDKLSADISSTRADIQTKKKQIEKQKTLLAETLRQVYEYDNMTPLEITLGNDTFSQFLDQIQYTTSLQEKDQQLINGIKILKKQLEDKEVQLGLQLAKQEAARQELTASQSALQKQRDGKQAVLAQTRGQEKIYQGLLNQAAQKQEQVEREIFNLEVAIRQKIGDKHLPAITGLLEWPMSGILTQGYGNTGFTALGYNFHNGIDIAAPAGTSIYAAGDGLVYATGTGSAAYGNWVVIKHTLSKNGNVTNIYTLYGHMQKIAASAGAAVRGVDIIGYEGNTGNTTRLLYGPERGYHLHFSVFDEDGFAIKGGAYQNIYGPYQIPYGYTYNPLDFLK